MENQTKYSKSAIVFFRQFFHELFYVATAAVLSFVLLELFWPGMVLAYFNLNYLLLFWLVVGIIILF